MDFMTAEVEIKVDDSRLKSQLAKAKGIVTKTVDKIKASFKKMGVSFKKVFDRMVRYAKWGAVGIVGAFALVMRAAMKQEDAIKRLEITLKATGHAAGFTKTQLLEQARSLQQVTRFGDETITAMQTMLLTFKNIRGDEFKRATEAALDMATAEAAVSGRAVDLTATSIRLGRALNDPLVGMSALTRVGVAFTEQQKSLIRELVMAGKVSEAQAVILDELAGEFGGMSRDVDTASGALRQMWNAVMDVAEKIGEAFIPWIKSAAKAVKEWAERNEEKIGRWAETFVAYVEYVFSILVKFVKYLKTDWQSGTKFAFTAAVEVVKGFVLGSIEVMKWGGKKAAIAFGEAMIDTITKIMMRGSPLAVAFSKLPGFKQLYAGIEDMRKKLVGVAGEQFAGMGVAPLAPRLEEIWKDVGASIKEIVPPELATEFEEPLGKLKESLAEIRTTAEEIAEPMEKALVEPPKKMSKAMEDAQGKLRKWASDARDVWGSLADAATSALNGTSDALTDLVLTGKADFEALAESIMKDLARIAVKYLMVQALGFVFPGTFGAAGTMPLVPSGQEGGKVTKTGLAVIHKGETLSGVEGGPKREEVALNINVNAIDAAGTFQFLNRNKRAIATMMQGMLTANHPIRRSKGWK